MPRETERESRVVDIESDEWHSFVPFSVAMVEDKYDEICFNVVTPKGRNESAAPEVEPTKKLWEMEKTKKAAKRESVFGNLITRVLSTLLQIYSNAKMGKFSKQRFEKFQKRNFLALRSF